jgi:hypothetical protein
MMSGIDPSNLSIDKMFFKIKFCVQNMLVQSVTVLQILFFLDNDGTNTCLSLEYSLVCNTRKVCMQSL